MTHKTDNESKCPAELFDAPATERLRYYKVNAVVFHPMMDRVVKEILEATGSLCDQNLILLVGPSGAGKTAALREAVRRAALQRAAEASSKPHIVPAIYLEADAPDRGNFDWRGFYEAGLAELGAPLIGHTLPTTQRIAGSQVVETLAPEDHHRSPSVGALRSRFQNTLRRRETGLVAVDEAVNLLQVHSTRNRQHRTDLLRAAGSSIRSLVNKSSATTVLAGAFDFYELASSNGQLARRSLVIYFPEYRESSKKDLAGFSKALLGLVAHLPVNHEIDPIAMGTEIFLQTLGCVGVVKTILQRALMKSLSRKRPLDAELLRSCYYPKAKLEVMRQEMLVGRREVEKLLTTDEFEKWLDPSSENAAEPRTNTPPKGPARRTRPFERKPSRRWRSDRQGQ